MDLIKLTATQAIEKIGSGELKSETLIRAYLERIQERDKDIKAWVHIEPELAIKQAKRIDSGAFKGGCLLYTSPSPRDGLLSRMPSSA